jgi:hypothetical protein
MVGALSGDRSGIGWIGGFDSGGDTSVSFACCLTWKCLEL